MVTDPVCGMRVDPNNAPASCTYNGHNFYFCSEECKQKFEANPEEFLSSAEAMNPEGYGTPTPAI